MPGNPFNCEIRTIGSVYARMVSCARLYTLDRIWSPRLLINTVSFSIKFTNSSFIGSLFSTIFSGDLSGDFSGIFFFVCLGLRGFFSFFSFNAIFSFNSFICSSTICDIYYIYYKYLLTL